MNRLKKRAEFLKVARGARTPRRGFLLQSMRQDAPKSAAERRTARRDATDGAATGAEPAGAAPAAGVGEARFGFTVTKKIGNAVERNRIRRRLREAVRLSGAAVAEPGVDYVLVGRRAALSLGFGELTADLIGALRATRKAGGGRKPDAGRGVGPGAGPAAGAGADRDAGLADGPKDVDTGANAPAGAADPPRPSERRTVERATDGR